MKRNYEDPVYKEWRKKVYARDRFKCQMPPVVESSGLILVIFLIISWIIYVVWFGLVKKASPDTLYSIL